jgi:cytochrome c553
LRKDPDVTHGQRLLAWLTCLGLAGLLGCERTVPPSPAAGPARPPAMPPGLVAEAPAAQGEFDTESGPHAAGKKVLVANGCFRCHTINGVRGPAGGGPGGFGPPGFGGPGGPPGGGPGGGPPMAGGPPGGGPPGGSGPPGGGRRMGGRGPDLGMVGKDPEHTVAWLMEHIRNPKVHKPDSRMPAFEGKIKDDDLRALAEYLASLKE